MKRNDGRNPQQLRPIKITKNYMKHAEGSCLIQSGETKVICTATVEEGVPPFLRGQGTGWVTAEYGMLPRSTNTRVAREKGASGRTQEIQRLIGRSLRSVVNMAKLGERTIKIDCDVIHADGGTRTASITGGFVALALAIQKLLKNKTLTEMPLTDYVAAVSVGVVDDTLMLDLNYLEDSNAQTDMNVVMLGKGEFVEIQGTAERKPFSKKDFDGLVALAEKGIDQLLIIQSSQLNGLKLK